MAKFLLEPTQLNFRRGQLSNFDWSQLGWIWPNFCHGQLGLIRANFVLDWFSWIWPNLGQGLLSQILVEVGSTKFIDRLNMTKFWSRSIQLNTTKFRLRLIWLNMTKFGLGPTRPNFRWAQLDWIRPNFNLTDLAKYDQNLDLQPNSNKNLDS